METADDLEDEFDPRAMEEAPEFTSAKADEDDYRGGDGMTPADRDWCATASVLSSV